MLSRFVLLAGAFSAVTFAAGGPSLSLFPEQGKSIVELNRQTLDRQINAAITGKQPQWMKNPVQMAEASMSKPTAQLNCAIPLDEINVPKPFRLDPIAKSFGSTNFDRMTKVTPVPACKNWK